MAKANSFNLAGLNLTYKDSLVLKSIQVGPKKGKSQSSLTWDIIKINKKSIILQAYPTYQRIRIKIDSV